MAKIYIVVYTSKDGDTEFLLDSSSLVAGSDYGHLVERIGKTVNHLKWLIAGSPTEVNNFFFGSRTEYTEISDRSKAKFQQIIDTIRIEPIHDVVLGNPGKHLLSMRQEADARKVRLESSLPEDNRTDLERHAI